MSINIPMLDWSYKIQCLRSSLILNNLFYRVALVDKICMLFLEKSGQSGKLCSHDCFSDVRGSVQQAQIILTKFYVHTIGQLPRILVAHKATVTTRADSIMLADC